MMAMDGHFSQQPWGFPLWVSEKRELKGLTEALLHRETMRGEKRRAHGANKHIVAAVKSSLGPQS